LAELEQEVSSWGWPPWFRHALGVFIEQPEGVQQAVGSSD
jgi:hypothetical protein